MIRDRLEKRRSNSVSADRRKRIGMSSEFDRLHELQEQWTAAWKAEGVAMALLEAYVSSGGDDARRLCDLLNEVSVAHEVAARVFRMWKATAQRLWGV